MYAFGISISFKESLVIFVIVHSLLLTSTLVSAETIDDDTGGTVVQLPSGDSKVFLPIISNSRPTVTLPDGGAAEIVAAGRLVSENNPGEDKFTSEVRQLLPETSADGPIKAIQCSIQDWTATEVRDLQDRMILDANAGIIYPGSLIQGKNLEDGYFTPVTIPRAGGKIFLEGLELEPNATYSRILSEISGSNVKQAIEDILSKNVVGTAARASYQFDKTYSYDHLLFTLGIDGRYQLATMKANLKIENEKKRNFVYLKFAQTFYDVVYEDPQLSTSVFRDGENFQDPEDQIRPGNSPLYVQKVSYGRIVFFVAESEYSAEDVQASLDAAYKGLSASVRLQSGLTYEEVMERTKVSYYVMGGSAGLALQPIDSATPQEMFEKVKSFLSNKKAADFSASNPGVPIAYTLRYLYNRNVARMSYTVNYGKQDCDVILGAMAEATVRFTNVHIIDDSDNVPSGVGEIWFDFSVYGADNEIITSRLPDSGWQDMDSGHWYPIERPITVRLNERDKLRIQVKGSEDDDTSGNDDMGTATSEWDFDTEWSKELPKTNDYYLCAKGSDGGEYCMYYQVEVRWVGQEPSHDPIRQANIIAQHSGKCANVNGGSPNNGTRVIQHECLSTQPLNQVWLMIPVGEYYMIAAEHSNRCLNVDQEQLDNGTAIIQYQCIETRYANQLWRLEPVGEFFHIIAKHSGKCLNVDGARQDNGTPLIQHDCIPGGASNELWSIVAVP